LAQLDGGAIDQQFRGAADTDGADKMLFLAFDGTKLRHL